MTDILVTGGAGYVGSHACKALAAAGYRPVTYDNLERGRGDAVKWGPLEQGDLSDLPRLREVFSTYRPAAVMHFAALAYVGESASNPALYYRNNILGALNLFEAMRQFDVAAVVVSSSCAVYGAPESTPIDEDHPKHPISPYGVGKWVVERMLEDLQRAHGLRSVCLRYFNAAGADPDGEIGETHDPETHLIPLVLDAALGRQPHITVFGADYDTPDGTCLRDYIHVTDLAEAHVLALKWLLSGSEASTALNLGVGKAWSVMEVIETARRVTGRTIEVAAAPRRAGDPPVLVADPTRAGKILGWSPRRSSLETQIADAWRWHLLWHGKSG